MKPEKIRIKTIIKICVVLICCAVAVASVYNDYGMYSRTVAEVVHVDNTGNEQHLTLQIKNNDRKGDTLKLKNDYDPSLVYDDKYHKRDQVFLSDNENSITGVKRDYQIAAAVLLVFAMLIMFGGCQGRLTVITFLINVAVFALMMKLYIMGFDILWLVIPACAIMSFVILASVCGLSVQIIPPLSATLLSILAVGLLMFLLLRFGRPVDYDFLDFLPEPYSRAEANHFFFAQTVIGCLGAVIDITVTITACSREIMRKNPSISAGQLISSVREISDDITGTMINVVFFTNIAATIPVFIVSMKNEVRFFTVIKYSAFFDISRFLAGGTAIMIAILISVLIASLFYGRKEAER